MTNTLIKDFVVVGGASLVAGGMAAIPASAQGFDGLYGGISYNNGDFESGDWSAYNAAGSSGGVFFGYNMSAGSWLFGAEVSFSNDVAAPNGTNDYYWMSVDQVVDLRARVGQVFGNTLVYGSVGYVTGTSILDSSYWSAVEETFTGSSVGVGFETNFSENSFFGAEVRRSDWQGDNYSEADGELTSVSVRMGMRF